MYKPYIILASLAVLVLVVWAAYPYKPLTDSVLNGEGPVIRNTDVESENTSANESPERITVQGVWECLPHKDTSGPQTMECAFGIAADQSDAHYALNLQLLASTTDFPTGTRIEVEGMFTPANELSSDVWQRYPIDGIISVTSIKRL